MVRAVTHGGFDKAFGAAVLVALLGACAQAPVPVPATHLQVEDTRPEGAIPAPVQLAPVLPAPKPVARPETYSVVVNNVPVHDLLFALARDARLNVDIHPGVTGSVTLNAIDQTLPQLLARISRQVDMRYEIDGQNLIVMRDTPYLRTYKVDYVSASRDVKMQSTSSTQFAASGPGGAAATGGGGATGSTATIDVVAKNQVWEAIVQNVKEILRETDKIIPKTAAVPGAAPTPAAAAPVPPAAGAAGAPPAASATVVLPVPQQQVEFIEQASVIGNRESGVLFVRATARQHEKIQEFLDQVLANIKRQVLIEATIAEVQLNNQYQRGIDWSRIRRGASGVSLTSSSAGTPAGVDTGFFVIDAAIASIGFQATMRLLESFGDVRVLSSPKVSVLNNQTALLRVTRDIVYFTLTPSSAPVTIAAVGGGTGTTNIQQAFSSVANVAAEGFMMSVLPQINETDNIVLNVRPTIRRRVAFKNDPNPALANFTPPIVNPVPEFETRELDSILRLQSGQVAVLGGLMQDSVTNIEDTIPGVRELGLLGEIFAQRRDVNQKTELVIFLRATVVRDPSVAGDFRSFGDMVPRQDFFQKPNPGRVAPPVMPSDMPRQ